MPASHDPYPEEQDELPEDPRYDDADISTIPFVQHTAYGRGLWRNPINFIPASSATSAPPSPGPAKAKNLAEAYLAIVFPNGKPQQEEMGAYPICGVCGGPIKESDDRTHYLSPAHQTALPRAPMPSGIDRTRMGLKYLERHGYDVDARVGLGAHGQGRLFPIMPREKRDKLGLGVDRKRIEREKKEALVPKDVKLDAGKVRKLAVVQKKKHEKLQGLFYGDDRVERLLNGREEVDHGLK